MDSSERMYSVKEAAFILGVSRDTVIRLIKRGHLKAIVFPVISSKRNRKYLTRRIPASELRRFMDGNERAA
jgi:hypothetical protein